MIIQFFITMTGQDTKGVRFAYISDKTPIFG